jgi:AcrR family transcriptional regulator
MDKREIQEERVRNYFITAAMELIRAEGIAVVSARNVAERAGYSYATLYNYFRDIRDLIFSCAEGFMAECRDFVEEGKKGSKAGADGIQAITESYAKFFIQYPGIFELLYEQKPSDMATKRSDLEKIAAFFDSLTEADWKVIRSEGKKEYTTARQVHTQAVHGLLLFFLNRRATGAYGTVMEKITRITRYLLS